MKRSFIREILEAIDENTISFAGGLPNEKLFPIKDLKKSSNIVFKNPNTFQYSQSNGLPSLKEKIAREYSKESLETKAENIMITTGSQQAMYILAKYFENSFITIEEPSYLGAINIFKLNNLKMQMINLSNNGINIKDFEKSFKKTKLAYLIPDFQNPSSSTYSKKCRKKIAKIVKKYNGFLIEDSPYSQLYFHKKQKSISSYIPNNSIHLGSFSKTLAPSFRLGYIRTNKKLINELTTIKESIDLHSCGLAQHILDNYLEDEKRYKKHLKKIRKNYKIKMKYFSKCLDKYLPNFSYIKPKGGMFIYGTLKDIDTFNLVQKCIKNGVVFVPGNQFYENKSKNINEIRFNFSHSNFKQIKQGIKLIKRSISL